MIGRAKTRHAFAATIGLAAATLGGCGPTPPSATTPLKPPPPAEPSPAEPPPAAASPARPGAPPSPPAVEDDGRTLWQSPTSGPPIAADGVVDGAVLVLHLRPKRLLASEEGRRVWRAFARLAERLDTGGRPIEAVDRLTVSLAVGERYGDNDTRVVVDAPPANSSPLLGRDLERLLDRSDADRHATLVIAPDVLLGGGGGLLGGSGAPLREFLLRYADDCRAAAVGLHLQGDRLYWELRVIGASTTPELARAARLTETLRDSPDELREIVAGRGWSTHAATLVTAAPAMLRTAARYARRGADGRQAVMNGYLPAKAAHNVALAAELLVAELSAPPPAGPGAAEARPATVADRLRASVTVVLERESLESALSVVANLAATPIEIAGRDLQLEGITRNQMLSLDLRDTPAETALVELLRRANPDPLATGPRDRRQRLVYTVRSDRVVVTTRSAARQRGETLPDAFRPEPAGP